MSIATLKNKTFKGGASPRVNPISSNGIFALNGTRRIRGVVGNTNLAPGNYSKTGVRSSCCADGETEVKLSVKNTRGMLSQRYDQLYYGEKCHVVQLTTDDSSSYIKKLHTINTCSFLKFKPGCNIPKGEPKICYKCPNIQNRINIYKDPISSMSQSDYIKGPYLKTKAYLSNKKTGGEADWPPHYPPNVINKCGTAVVNQ